jgi:hypothetical protein
MSTTMPQFKEWYVVDGVEFATPGYWIGSVDKGNPERKGQNVDTPSIHGSQWREKRLGVRAETWTIVVTDADPVSGSVSSTEEQRRTQFNSNYDTVMRVINKLPQLLTIDHYRISSSSPVTRTVRRAYGEIISAFQISDHRELGYSQFSVDVIFPDPRWYDTSNTTLTSTISSGTSASVACTQTNVGTAPVTYMTITFASTVGYSLVDPKLTNSTYVSSTSVIGYTGTISSGASVVIDTDALTVKDGGGTNLISGLYRYGARQDWMELFPTTNTLTFSCASGRGTVSIAYKKAYI